MTERQETGGSNIVVFPCSSKTLPFDKQFRDQLREKGFSELAVRTAWEAISPLVSVTDTALKSAIDIHVSTSGGSDFEELKRKNCESVKLFRQRFFNAVFAVLWELALMHAEKADS